MGTKDKESNEALVEAKTTALAAAAEMNFEEDAGAGLEGADAKSFAIPFITLLQGLSPQCEPVKDGGVEGAKAGLFINTITNELYEEVFVVPAAFKREFLRWAPRSSGGGFKGFESAVDVDLNRVAGMSTHGNRILMDVPAGESPFDDKGLPKFDLLSDTRQHYVMAKNKAGGWFPALISLGSTQIKKSKKWLSLVSGVELIGANGKAYNPPSFSHIYKLTSIKEENAKGKWQGYQIDVVRKLENSSAEDVELFNRAKKFNKDVVAGQVEVSPPMADADVGENPNDKF